MLYAAKMATCNFVTQLSGIGMKRESGCSIKRCNTRKSPLSLSLSVLWSGLVGSGWCLGLEQLSNTILLVVDCGYYSVCYAYLFSSLKSISAQHYFKSGEFLILANLRYSTTAATSLPITQFSPSAHRLYQRIQIPQPIHHGKPQ